MSTPSPTTRSGCCGCPGQKTFFLPPKPFIPPLDIIVPPEPEVPELVPATLQDVGRLVDVKTLHRSGWGKPVEIRAGGLTFVAHLSKTPTAQEIAEAHAYAEVLAKRWSSQVPRRRRVGGRFTT